MTCHTTLEEFHATRAQMRGSVALVPTMGALHEGHAALIRRAGELAHHVVVWIFVNPAQFGPQEDFGRYPRSLEQDVALCEEQGAEAVLAPAVEAVYPPGRIAVAVSVPSLARELEGSHRPGHFEGVCRVCCKMFNLVRPHVAVFGRKDYQQLCVIEAMVEDLEMPLRIEAVDTVRESDGLALSSRNRYLDGENRRRAVGLHKALQQARAMIEEGGETDPAAVERTMMTVMQAHQIAVDYAAVRHPRTLRAVDCVEPSLTGGIVALVAGRLGQTRLIDNLLIGR